MLVIAARLVGKLAMLVGVVVIGDVRDHAEQRIKKRLHRTATASSELPEHAYASVLAGGCSGTIISCGERWACGVTAAHCFRGFVNGKFQVTYLDGSKAEATLLAVDRSRDLARFAVPAESVLDVAPVSEKMPDRARYEAVGFPANEPGRKPRYYLLHLSSQPVTRVHGEQFVTSFYTNQGGPAYNQNYASGGSIDPSPLRYQFDAVGGHVFPGASGCGVFANGRLIGVLSNNNGHNLGTVVRCCTLDQLVSFLRETDKSGCDKWDMGNWEAHPIAYANAPSALPYTAPEKVQHSGWDCRNGRCRPIAQAPQAYPIPPPPEFDAPPQPEGHVAPPPPEKARKPLLQRIREGSGREKLPKDVKGNCNQAERILELQNEIRRLESEIGNVQRQPGPPGRDGQDGRDGRDLTPPAVAEKPKPKFPHAIFAGLASFCGVLIVGGASRFNAGLSQKGR